MRHDRSIVFNNAVVGDGHAMLKMLKEEQAAACFFDPQYKALVEKQAYGDTASPTGKMAKVHALPGMSEALIKNMIIQIERVLQPSGHLFLWVDKYMLVQGVGLYLGLTDLQPVDMITWDKQRIGMGYRSRRKSEYLVVLQKEPKRAKGCWIDRGIPDVWPEAAARGAHPHAKPLGLIERLIRCTTNDGDLVVDPAAGSFTVMKACHNTARNFAGCDLIDPSIYASS